MTIKAIGTDDSRIRSKAGNAALAKKACDAADHIAVDRVLKPIGLRINVAGSSFMTVKKTSAAPARIPDRTRGKVIVVKTLNGVRPRLRAASSIRGLTCLSEVL